MPKAPDGRVLVQPCGDLIADAEAVINAILESDANLFEINGSRCWLRDGARVPAVQREVVLEIIDAYVASKRPVQRDGRWDVEFVPLELDESVQKLVQTGKLPAMGRNEARELRGGGLFDRVPKVYVPEIADAA